MNNFEFLTKDIDTVLRANMYSSCNKCIYHSNCSQENIKIEDGNTNLICRIGVSAYLKSEMKEEDV